MIVGIMAADSGDDSGGGGDVSPDTWVTIYDATTGVVSGDVNVGGRNTRLFVDAASTVAGGSNKVRVTFKAAAAADLVIDNAAIGVASTATSPWINYSGSPVVLLFGGVADKTVPAGTEFTSDEATFSFADSNHLLVAINHGASSQICGRAESGCVIYSKTLSGDDTTNASISSGAGEYGLSGSSNNSYGVSKIEVKT